MYWLHCTLSTKRLGNAKDCKEAPISNKEYKGIPNGTLPAMKNICVNITWENEQFLTWKLNKLPIIEKCLMQLKRTKIPHTAKFFERLRSNFGRVASIWQLSTTHAESKFHMPDRPVCWITILVCVVKTNVKSKSFKKYFEAKTANDQKLPSHTRCYCCAI